MPTKDDQLQRRIRDLEIINRVAKTLNAQLDPTALYERIVSEIAEELRCTHCTIFIAEEEDGELLLVPKETRAVRREEILRRRFKPGEGLAGWVFESGESLVLEDARKDPRFAAPTDPSDKPRSMIIAPVKIRGKTVGVISADQDRFGWFGESDRLLVDALAQHAGVAIERANALRLLQDVSVQISARLEEEETLDTIIKGAMQLTGTDSGVIHLLNEKKSEVLRSYQVAEGFSHLPSRFAKKTGLTWEIVYKGEILAIPDITQDARVNPEMSAAGVRAMIGVPLSAEGETIGALFLNDSDVRDFTDYEINLLSTLATQAAIAIRNSRLYQDARTRAEQLSRLDQVAEAMTRIASEEEEAGLDGVLRTILESIDIVLGQETTSCISLYDPARRVFGNRHASGPLADHLLEFPPRSDGTGAYVIRTKQPLYVNDVDCLAVDHPCIRTETAKVGVKSFTMLPLMIGQDVVGTLFVNLLQPHLFTEETRTLLDTFADQAAVAIENAKLFQELKERASQLEKLQRVTAAISAGAFELEQVFDLIADNLREIFEEAWCVVRMYDPDSGEFGRWFSAGHSTERIKYSPRKTGSSRHVVKTKTPRYLEDLTAAPSDGGPAVRQEILEEGVTAAAHLPLIAKDAVTGILYVSLRKPHRFSENDRRILELFAGQAAIAIENARLFEELQGELKRTEALSQLGADLAHL